MAISLLKFVPTNAKVKSKVTPNPKDIIVIGVILLVWVIFLIDTFKRILELKLNFLSEYIIIFESRKKTIKQIKNATKYPKLYEAFSELNVNINTKANSKIILNVIDFFE